jgi:regulatory protein
MVDRKDPGPRLLDRDRLLDYALKVLGGRAHSSGELREKLRRRAAVEGDADEVLSHLKQLGYLDDRRFAETFASLRLANDKLGRTRVLQDLRSRRVAPSLAESSVKKVYQDVNEESLIETWIRRKYRTAQRDGLFADDKEMAAAYRRLARAGFRSGDIIRVLKRFARNPELLDDFEPPAEPED